MRNKDKKQPQLDLFAPIYEIFHEICLLLGGALKEVSLWAFNKLVQNEADLKKIERKSLKSKKTTQVEDALGIDTKTRKEILLKDIDFKRHSFIVGASGFGKTNLISILQENSLRQNKPIIFVDPKGDMDALTTFKRICEKYDRPCFIFSEHYHDSISLNPIKEGSVNQVVDRIMRAFEWSEPFYRDASRRSLVKALKTLELTNEAFTLNTVLEELLKNESKENLGLITKIEAINESDFGKILNTGHDGLTFSKIREKNACLYVGLSTQGYGETATAIGKLFLGEFLYNSYKSLTNPIDPEAGLKNPISIYLDEFGALVTPEFIELQNKCRGAGMELTLAVQTASDIDRVSSDLTKQIIENAANLFVLKQRLDSSAGLFADAIGTTLSKKETFMMEDGTLQNKGSVREVNELLVHPDIIKNLGIGQCVLLRQGPTRINLINVRNRKIGYL
jgi:conjugal transfer pilus assembly protein TraD